MSEEYKSSVSLDQITEGKYDGEGVFDTLMRTVSTQLERQFIANRLTGNDIASVMSSVIPGVLEQSIVYTLTRCKTDIEIEILRQQAIEAKWKAKIAEVEHDANILLLSKIRAEIALIKQQTVTELANVDPSAVKPKSVIDTQIKNTEQQTKVAAKQELLVQQQTETELANIDPANVKTNSMIDTQIKNTKQQTELVSQQEKLVKQQTTTELANVDPTAILGEESMLGIQRLVQQRQADGFLRDAEQKAVNMLWDLIKVEMSIGEEVDMNLIGAGNANLKKSMIELMTNAGITGIT